MKYFDRVVSELRNRRLLIHLLFINSKDRVSLAVPYVIQFAHPEYAEKILRDDVERSEDPWWKKTGAKSPKEYATWVLVVCGMACTAMALDYFKRKREGIISLAKDAMDHGVYQKLPNGISDMRYREFACWIKEYELRAEIYTRISLRNIQKLLTEGKLVVISVNPNIRGYATACTNQKGGHLILITGYNKADGTITFHNPSGFLSQSTQENHMILIKEFYKYYAGRGIALGEM